MEPATWSSLWSVVVIVGPILLAAALIYGLRRASRKRKLGALNQVRDAKTRELYTTVPEDEKEPTGAGHRTAAVSGSARPTEDDIARAKLGPRGVPGEPDVSRMTPQRDKKTPHNLEPGHTA